MKNQYNTDRAGAGLAVSKLIPGQQCRVVAALMCALLWTACGAGKAEVVRAEVLERESFADGKSFGRTGPYEIVRGRFFLEVDPRAPANQRITDLQLAPRDTHGKVGFWSDFFLLKPVNPERGNRAVLFDVDNRGNKLALWTFNGAKLNNRPSKLEDAGDGLLMREGYAVLWCGWNGDVMDDGTDRMSWPVRVPPDASPKYSTCRAPLSIGRAALRCCTPMLKASVTWIRIQASAFTWFLAHSISAGEHPRAASLKTRATP